MAAGLGSLSDYLASAGTTAADVGTAAGTAGSLGSLLGLSNPITLLPSLASLGLNLAGINPIGDLLSSLQGLPASTKPDMYANYLSSLGGLPSDLGSLINAAQQQVGPGTGLLSMSGAGAFNPNFMATLLEALTGQNLGAIDPSTGRITLTAPATGGVQNPVSLSFLPESSLMSSPGMAGLSAYGYTPQQLSSPAALKAIETATNYGLVGTGAGAGTSKVAQYLPAVVSALQQAGINPATGPGSTLDYLNQPQQSDTGTTTTTNTTGGGGGGGDIVIPLGSLGSTGGGGTTTGGGGGTQLTLPLGSLSNLVNTSPSTATSSSVSNPTQNLIVTQLPSAKFGQGYSSIGFARPGQNPQTQLVPIGNAQPTIGVAPLNIPQQQIGGGQVITPQMDMSGVSGGQSGLLQLLQQLLSGGGSSTSQTASAQPWTVAG